MASPTQELRRGIAVIRITAGLLLLSAGWHALRTATPDGDTLAALIAAGAERPFPFGAWASGVLSENPPALALLWRWLLFLSGLLLALGALTRPAATVGLVLVVHAWAYGPAESHQLHFLLLAVLGVCIWKRAGLEFGFDRLLDAALPRSVTWTPPSRKDLF